jgi:hypothetical protein
VVYRVGFGRNWKKTELEQPNHPVEAKPLRTYKQQYDTIHKPYGKINTPEQS